MRRLDVGRFSRTCAVRLLTEADIGAALEVYRGNPLFFRGSGRVPDAESVLRDMTLLPPDVPPERKYYAGYFAGGALTAVLDLIDGYPDPDTAFLGLFMVHGADSGQGKGGRLIGELCAALGDAGMQTVRLAYDRDNPQSSHFWRKNGFLPIYETESPEYGHLIVAERRL